ncbi:hypothetical protein H0H87_006739, partial [Tephrocybe sp. NHM501043]
MAYSHRSPKHEYQTAYHNRKNDRNYQAVQLAKATCETARLEKELASQRVKEAEYLLAILRQDELHLTIKFAESAAQFDAAKLHISTKETPKELDEDDASASSGDDCEEESKEMEEYFYSLAAEPGQPLTEDAVKAFCKSGPSALPTSSE